MNKTSGLIILGSILFVCIFSSAGCMNKSPTVVATPTPTPYATFRIFNNSSSFITSYYDRNLHMQYYYAHSGTQTVTSVLVQWMWPLMINGSIKTCSIPYGSTMDVTVPMPGNDTYLCNVIIFNEYGSQDNWENFQLEAGSTHLVNINGITLSTLDSFGIMNTGSFF